MSENSNGPRRVEGKVALVTGAASGIGKATAALLAREGARVAVADINEQGARASAREIAGPGREAVALALDVTSEEDWARVVSEVVERWGRLDILVNNAGISFGKPFTETGLEEWRKVMAVNLDSVFLGTKHCAQVMREGGGGSIINISSASGTKASAGASAYCASKAAVRMYSKAIALECARNGDNIRVNTVSPSGVRTPMWESMQFWQDMKRDTGSDEANYSALSADVPMKRFATPEEIAEAVLFLASDESSFITGADIPVDGGYTA
ncbi:MAG TPA: glucose 1-dehydrogenase [Blastocatellia bacterium]|nr:glucose 1-dehydrogenase [Blastocatellia bacterium]